VFYVGVFCGSDLFTSVCASVLYIVFSYTHFSYMRIKSFYFLHVNHHDVPA